MSIETSRERRKHNRLDIPASAVLFYEQVELGHYVVQNLCGGGALLTGGPNVQIGDEVQVLLKLHGGSPPIELSARIVRRVSAFQGLTALAIEFEHESPATEDEIQEALLGMLDPTWESGETWFEDDFDLPWAV